ncbi:MAG: hypothetical protein KTR13_07785 [Saprospiraceae bacterium]|nr:hypothetical protein [Saprospiraceae bacterium]
MKNFTFKFVRKPHNISLEQWTETLNFEGRSGWRIVQIFSAPDGKLTAVMEKHESIL